VFARPKAPKERKSREPARTLKALLGVELTAATTTSEPNRRDFIFLATGAVGAVGVAALAWPFIDQMNPDASTLAMASIEVDIGAIAEGQIVTVKWRGGPVFVRHRTAKEIKEAQDVQLTELRDPQTDAQRVQKPEWLIVVGVCTHLGCVPIGHEGKYEGWFCPCHGSVYDTSGRIRQGPAPLNLAVPEYKFLTDTKVKIG
jgi:ubiquinol-cytochrome c reductase iron-sulfur subunit